MKERRRINQYRENKDRRRLNADLKEEINQYPKLDNKPLEDS